MRCRCFFKAKWMNVFYFWIAISLTKNKMGLYITGIVWCYSDFELRVMLLTFLCCNVKFCDDIIHSHINGLSFFVHQTAERSLNIKSNQNSIICFIHVWFIIFSLISPIKTVSSEFNIIVSIVWRTSQKTESEWSEYFGKKGSGNFWRTSNKH